MALETRNGSNGVEVGSAIEAEFSHENFKAYARACKDIAWKTIELASDSRAKDLTVVLPSRGAVPLMIGAIMAMQSDPEFQDFWSRGWSFQFPPLQCFSRLSGHTTDDADRNCRVLILPFTADVYFDPRSSSMDTNQAKSVADMRSFMSRVAVELLFTRPDKRKGFEFNMYLKFLELIEGRKGLANFYRNFTAVDRGEPVLFVDTVISGRASHTILNEFEKLHVSLDRPGTNKSISPILVVDQDGKKVKREFGKYIYGLPNHVVKLPRILTEDRGAALEGVVAVVYSNLIEASRKSKCGPLVPCFGSWHDVPRGQREKYHEVFFAFLDVLDATIRSNGDFDRRRQILMKLLKDGKFLHASGISLKEAEEFTRCVVDKAAETSSHVIQVDIKNPQGYAKDLCKS